MVAEGKEQLGSLLWPCTHCCILNGQPTRTYCIARGNSSMLCDGLDRRGLDIQPVHPKGDQSWVFTGRTDAKAESPILWPPHVKSWLIGKDPDAGRDWGQEEKGTTEDEMAGWHHWLDGHWVWVNSGSWWWTGRPGVLRFMGLQRVGHDWATELNWGRMDTYTCMTESLPCSPGTVTTLFIGYTKTPNKKLKKTPNCRSLNL